MLRAEVLATHFSQAASCSWQRPKTQTLQRQQTQQTQKTQKHQKKQPPASLLVHAKQLVGPLGFFVPDKVLQVAGMTKPKLDIGYQPFSLIIIHHHLSSFIIIYHRAFSFIISFHH